MQRVECQPHPVQAKKFMMRLEEKGQLGKCLLLLLQEYLMKMQEGLDG